MAEHFRGLMQGYEIWNEPSGPLSLEEYAPMHRAMVQALRQGDPSVRLIGLCAMPKHADWIKKTVDEGLGDGLTAISFHDYIRIAPELSMPQVLVSLFGEGKQYLTDAGLSGMPLWDTESGYLQNVDNRPRPQSSGSPKLFYKTIEEQARFTVRQHFLSFAAGLELKSTFFLQSVSYDQWWAWSPFRADALNSALPMSAAYSVMSSLLRDAEPRQVVYEPTGNVYAYAFRDEKRRQSIVALWTVHEPKTVESRLPAPAKVLDLYGRQLPAMPTAAGPDPVYLIWPDDRLPADWPSRLLPESGQFVPYNIWHTDRKQLVVEDENSPKQPPVQADIILPAAESRFFTWDPGVQEVKGAVNDRILVMGPPAKPLTGRMVVEFQANLREGESGSWQIWASIGPMFFHEYSELALQVDGNPPVRIRGLDTPAELAWQYFTTVNLTPGVHRIRILSGAELDGKKETVSRQVLDAVILHRVEDKKQ
jgi:hypothetical protein